MALDDKPGKYTSEKGGFYFSCDDGKSVLVGVKGEIASSVPEHMPASKWTCPAVGMVRYDIPEGKELEVYSILERDQKIVYGSEDGAHLSSVPLKDWVEATGEKLDANDPEWGSGQYNEEPITDRVAVIFGDRFVIRLHFAFE